MKRRDALATVGALAVAGTHQVWAQQPIVIKFSHVVANDTPKGKGALKFKELAEKYTGGKVKVEVYPNSTLYKDKEEMDALNSGSVQILAPSTAKFRPIGVPEFEVMDLPYIFNGQEGYEKIVDGPIGKSLFKKLETKGITGLAYWDNGFHMVSANKPLLLPADFQGLKIRISGSKIADLYFRALGALPQIEGEGIRQGRLTAIPGRPPRLIEPPEACRFAPRCPYASANDDCTVRPPELREIRPGHCVRSAHPASERVAAPKEAAAR